MTIARVCSVLLGDPLNHHWPSGVIVLGFSLHANVDHRTQSAFGFCENVLGRHHAVATLENRHVPSSMFRKHELPHRYAVLDCHAACTGYNRLLREDTVAKKMVNGSTRNMLRLPLKRKYACA